MLMTSVICHSADTVIYDFSHAVKRALGVSLLHLKPITIKEGDYCIIHAWKRAAG